MIIRFATLLLILGSLVSARPPQTLPGDELSNSNYLNYMVKNTLSEQELQELQSGKIGDNSTIDTIKLFLTWNAPSIADQIAADTAMIRLGMGAIFVPRMSEPGAIEPDIMIKNETGKLLQAGQTGRKFDLLPGMYTIHIGNLAEFPLTRDVYVEEGKVTPVMPDWCALRIEVVDENAAPIRGEYDLASLDPLTPIGRGRGRDIDLNEDLRIWFVPAGTYKILGVGASLNSISNFLTVRLPHPGEFVRFTVVQDTIGKILGGGVLLEDLQGRNNSSWTHNFNVGGNIDFNYVSDKLADTSGNTTALSLLVYDRLSFKRNKVEISNLIKADVTLSTDEFKLKTLRSTVDELRATTLMTYRLFPRFGPYARGEYVSAILPKAVKALTSEIVEKSAAPTHTFIYLDSVPKQLRDTDVIKFDSTSQSVVVSPFISPVHLQTGVGGNVQVMRNRVANMRFLTGFGLDYEKKWDSWEAKADKDLVIDSTNSIYTRYYRGNVLHTTLVRSDDQRFEYGPEFMLNTNLYLSRYISAESDIRLFMPTNRIETPDFVMRNLISLHITGNLILDYDYNYSLVQASQEKLQTDQSRHRVLIRLSFSK